MLWFYFTHIGRRASEIRNTLIEQITKQIKTHIDLAVYKNVMDRIDVEYSISSNKIKETLSLMNFHPLMIHAHLRYLQKI